MVKKDSRKDAKARYESKDLISESGLSLEEQKLLEALVKGTQKVPNLAAKLDMNSRKVFDIARKLRHKGYAIQIHETSERIALAREGQVLPGFISIEDAAREFTFLVIAEPRFGSKQAQISTLHWIYKNIVDAENVQFVAAVGLVAGRPTPSMGMDIHKLTSRAQIDYVANNFPHSAKGCKTYVISGLREQSWKTKTGLEVARAICSGRDDLVYAGELERTFNVRGVLIKVMEPWDDNSPRGKSYGVQKNAQNISDNPFPNLIIYAGTHVASYLPAYVNGAGIVTVPSLHQQMTRQRKKAIAPQIGCTLVKLFFDKDWKLESVKVDHRNLGLPELVHEDDYLEELVDVDLRKLEKCIPGKEAREQALAMLQAFFKQPSRSRGELRRLIGKPQNVVDERIAQLRKCGFEFESPEDSLDTKSITLVRREKETFRAPDVDPEAIFQWKTKEVHVSDTHYVSKEDLPKVVLQALQDAARAGVRRAYNSGDLSDGAGNVGYRGHANDVRTTRMDDIEDYMVANWPRVQLKVDPNRPPVLVTKLFQDEQGRVAYREEFAKDGTVPLQSDIIDGNHDGWAEMAIGHLPGRSVAVRLPEHIRHLGYMYGSTVVDAVYHKLLHNAGGLGYTMSYRLQAHIGAMRNRQEGENLPKVLSVGNNHCAYALLDGDILAAWIPCFKWEDVFHVTRGLVPWIGSWIFELYAHPNGQWTRVVLEYRNYFSQAMALVKSRG